MFNSDNSDEAEMFMQMKLLLCRSNMLVRMFNKCSQNVLIELCRNFCTTFIVLIFLLYKKGTFSKLRVAHNNVNCKVWSVKSRNSASEMFVLNNISNLGWGRCRVGKGPLTLAFWNCCSNIEHTCMY